MEFSHFPFIYLLAYFKSKSDLNFSPIAPLKLIIIILYKSKVMVTRPEKVKVQR